MTPRPGNSPVRMSDIALQASCSRGAVTNVLTGAGEGLIRVGKEKAKLIRQIAEQLNFEPNLGPATQGKGKPDDWANLQRVERVLRLAHFVLGTAFCRRRRLPIADCSMRNVQETQLAVRQFRSRGVDSALLFMQRSTIPDAASQRALAELPRLVSLFGASDSRPQMHRRGRS